MKNRKDLLNDVFLNRMLKILGILILLFALLYTLTLFSSFWQTLWFAFRNVLIPVALAWVISLIIYPIIIMFERRGIRPRALNVTLMYLFGIAFIYGVIVVFSPFFTQQIEQFFTRDYPLITDYFAGAFREEFFLGKDAYDFFARVFLESAYIQSAVENFFERIGGFIPSTLYALIMVIAVLPIVLLFYLLDYERVNFSLRKLVPKRHAKITGELIDYLNKTVGAYIRGQLFLIVIMGVIATVIFKLIGLEYYFLFGILVGLANIIPYFGILIAMLPIVSYAFIARDFAPNPLLIVGISIVLQFIEGNIFQPIIIGKNIQIHPLIIIASILFFGSLFGVLGIIFATPIAATIKVLTRFYREQKNLDTNGSKREDVKVDG